MRVSAPPHWRFAQRPLALPAEPSLFPTPLFTVAQAVHELVESEKQAKLLKWFAAIVSGLLLLSVAATVGLTFAVVELSKDTQASDGLLLEKSSGGAMVVGSPTIALLYDPADDAAMAELFNATSVADLAPAATRRLLGATDSCVDPQITALAIVDLKYVKKQCGYIRTPSADRTFVLSWALGSRTTGKKNSKVLSTCGDAAGRLTTKKGSSKCTSLSDKVHATEDQCDLILDMELTCADPAAKPWRVAIMWLDSVFAPEKPTSYLLSCEGTCGPDRVVALSKCGVFRAQCPVVTAQQELGQRRLLGAAGGATFNGMPMNCESGQCFVAAH